MNALRLRVATWNVHGFVGADRRRDPERVLSILRSLEADVIALQEVDSGGSEGTAFDSLGQEVDSRDSQATAFDSLGQEVDSRDSQATAFDSLGRALGFQALAGPTLARPDGPYGNLLLTRFAVRRLERLDLSEPGREPRGAIDATLDVDETPVRVLATHLGLDPGERARQARRLCDALDADRESADLVVLLGDLNEWRPLPRTGISRLLERFAHRSRRRTFPARAPLLALDRVLVDRPEARVGLRTVGGPRVRSASDHLALHAEIELGRARP